MIRVDIISQVSLRISIMGLMRIRQRNRTMNARELFYIWYLI